MWLLSLVVLSVLHSQVVRSQKVLNIPTRYNKPKITELTDTKPEYFVIPLCSVGSGGEPLGKLTINIEDNVSWDPAKGGVIAAEIGTSQDIWNEKTIVAVNYVFSGFKLIPHPHVITFPYNMSDYPDKNVYMRFKSTQAVYFMFEFTFTNKSENFKGQFNPQVFNQPQRPPDNPPQQVKQFLRLASDARIGNDGAGLLLQFQFCAQNFPQRWTVKVTVTASVGFEASAFDLFLCPLDKTKQYCTKSNIVIPPENKNTDSTSVVSAQIQQGSTATIENGLYALIVGRGGTGINVFNIVAERQ